MSRWQRWSGLRPALSQRWSRLALLAAITALSWQLAMLFWLFLAPPRASAPELIPLPPPVLPQVPQVTSFNLFPVQMPATPVASMPPPLVSPVSLTQPMKLEGVFVSSGGRSAAVIQVNGRSGRYRVGQKLEETGLRLASVSWSQVILRTQSGDRARLKFGDTATSAVMAAPLPASVPPAGAMPAYGNPGAVSYPGSAAGMPSGVHAALGGMPSAGLGSGGGAVPERLQQAISQMSANPGQYVSQMGLASTGNGYEVNPNAPAALINQLGLRPGDRILSVNGQSLGNPQNDINVLRQVQQSRQATIQVQRGSQTLTLSQNF